MARRLLLAAFVIAPLALTPLTDASPSLESAVFAKINAARGTPFIHHSGLHAVAYAHSQDMSRSGSLHHNNADSRITNAQPDPVEMNGAPDDGNPPAAWCENVTYSQYHPESEVAGRIYSQWANSGAHQQCMTSGRNVAAVGIYYDGSAWWATFIATQDNTPPGGAAPPKAKESPPANDEGPAPTKAPAPAPSAAPDAPAPDAPAADTPDSYSSVPDTSDGPGIVDQALPDMDVMVLEPGASTTDSGPDQVQIDVMPASGDDNETPTPPAAAWPALATMAGLLVPASLVLKRSTATATIDEFLVAVPKAKPEPAPPPPSSPLFFAEERSVPRT